MNWTESESCNIYALGIGYTVYGILLYIEFGYLKIYHPIGIENDVLYSNHNKFSSQLDIHRFAAVCTLYIFWYGNIVSGSQLDRKFIIVKRFQMNWLNYFTVVMYIQFEKLFLLLYLKVISKLLLFGYPSA